MHKKAIEHDLARERTVERDRARIKPERASEIERGNKRLPDFERAKRENERMKGRGR